MQSHFHCLVFEYSDQVDLHEHLLLNKPTSKAAKSALPSNGSLPRVSLDNLDFIDMALQVCGLRVSLKYFWRILTIENVVRRNAQGLLGSLEGFSKTCYAYKC